MTNYLGKFMTGLALGAYLLAMPGCGKKDQAPQQNLNHAYGHNKILILKLRAGETVRQKVQQEFNISHVPYTLQQVENTASWIIYRMNENQENQDSRHHHLIDERVMQPDDYMFHATPDAKNPDLNGDGYIGKK